MTELKPRYRCPVCDDVFDTKDEAETCRDGHGPEMDIIGETTPC